MDSLFRLFGILTTLGAISAAPEEGKFSKTLSYDSTLSQDLKYAGFVKTLYKNSTVRLKVTNINCEGSVQISWLLRSSSCYGEFQLLAAQVDPTMALNILYTNPQEIFGGGVGYFLKSKPEEIQCQGEHTIHVLKDYSNDSWTKYPEVKPTMPAPIKSDVSATSGTSRQKRADPQEDDETDNNRDSNDLDIPAETQRPPTKEGEVAAKKGHNFENAELPSDAVTEPTASKVTENKNKIAHVPHTAPYILVVLVAGNEEFSVDIEAEMETPFGYLSAREYPLKMFYMIMWIMYLLLAVAWLVLSAYNFRELRCIHFWIGSVVVLGLIENAAFYLEYWTVNKTGVSVMAVVLFSELVSALESTVAIMLLIVISCGFGIVKPFHARFVLRVVAIGMLFGISAVANVLVQNYSEENKLFTAIALGAIDFIIFCWIIIGLVRTTKTLRLQQDKNLTLYRYCSCMIAFCVIAYVVMFLLMIVYWGSIVCGTAWQNMWILEAFWLIAFYLMLLVITILLRPTANCHKYAFTPLLKTEEGAEEHLVNPKQLSSCTDSTANENAPKERMFQKR